MADLLLARRPSGKHDFVRRDGDLERTNNPSPSILRLLLQGPWVGDNGERSGDCLNDVRLLDTSTEAKVTTIVETRLGVLTSPSRGVLDAVEVLGVENKGDRVDIAVQVTEPGAAPAVLYVPLTR